MNKPCFDFLSDKGKEPLVSFTIKCGELDYKQLEQAVLFRSMGAYIFTVLGCVISVFILIQILLMAIAAGDYFAAACYTAFALLIAFEMYLNAKKVKKAVRNAPNDSESFTYAFYKHHFTFWNDYEAIYEDYDNIERADENVLEFMLFGRNGRTYLIPKNELDEKQRAMLHAVMENKLGSKFTVKSL